MQHIHENNGKTFLMVEVYEQVKGEDCRIHNGYIYQGGMSIRIPLLPGNWQIIGKGNELSEEQWKDIQDKEEVICNDFTSYTEAGLSMLSSLSLYPPKTLILQKI